MAQNNNIIILGSSGLVASQVLDDWRRPDNILIPNEQELDILNQEALKKYLTENSAPIVINFVGYTNLAEGEKDKGNKTGTCWQLNVTAIEQLAQICQENNKFLVHISTDNVFAGLENDPGPYSEDHPLIDNQSQINWYGYAKLQGELAIKNSGVKSAIVRISHPFGNPKVDRDFAQKVITYINAGYTLFDDQHFTPTYLPDLSMALKKITSEQLQGIYHIVCQPLSTPFEFAQFIAQKKNLPTVKVGRIDEWAKENPNSYPRVKFGGLKTDFTQKKLGLKFHSWQEALEEFLPLL
ncbi:MAG: sugar nucleotide-binding protein [Candidatus Daviesbacteria bacterium]|nr:sugar nucleotide-binding protein [Candidatus Daviesbacteria bacterium]